MSEYNFTKFQNAHDDAIKSKDVIDYESSTHLKFGINFLDESLIGISRSDLVLLGGRSGSGKTELATHIAMTNVLAGKKVYFFALEAEMNEIGLRIKYKVLSSLYFSDSENRKRKKYIAYDRWLAGCLKNEFSPYEELANSAIEKLTGIVSRYGSENYSINNYEKDLEEVKSSADLVIIDHLHYFDIDESQANAEIKTLVRKIKALAMEYKIPVVLVSHIRKQDKRYSGLVPDQEDFHGSSDIIKIATKAITIASARNKKCIKFADECTSITTEINISNGSSSFIKVVKNRRNGSICAPVALTTFNHDTNTYSSGYYLGDEKSEKGEVIFSAHRKDEKFPLWAEGALNE